MKTSLYVARPVAQATVVSHVVKGFQPAPQAKRLVLLPDGSLGTHAGLLEYDRH